MWEAFTEILGEKLFSLISFSLNIEMTMCSTVKLGKIMSFLFFHQHFMHEGIPLCA